MNNCLSTPTTNTKFLVLLLIIVSSFAKVSTAQENDSLDMPQYLLHRQLRQSVEMPRFSIRFDALAIAFREVGLAAAYRVHHNNYLEAEAGYVYAWPYSETNTFINRENISAFRASKGWFAGLNYQMLYDLTPAQSKPGLFKYAFYVDFGINVKQTSRAANRFETFAVYDENASIAAEERTLYGFDCRLRQVLYFKPKVYLDVFIALGARFHDVKQERFNYHYVAQNWREELTPHRYDFLSGSLALGLRLLFNP